MYKKRTSNGSIQISSIKLFNYFLKLKLGEKTGKIYCEKKDYKVKLDKFTLRNAEEVIDASIRKTLLKNKIGNIIDIKNKIGLENVGLGAIITPAMFGSLIIITQKKASFYFLTESKKIKKLKFVMLSIPKISGYVKFEDKVVDRFSIPTLTEYKKIIEIEPELIHNKVSKVSIIVDKCWSPNYLDNNLPNFPLGVAIQSIKMS